MDEHPGARRQAPEPRACPTRYERNAAAGRPLVAEPDGLSVLIRLTIALVVLTVVLIVIALTD